MEIDKGSASERSVKSRAILARQANGMVADQVCSCILSRISEIFLSIIVNFCSYEDSDID